MILAGKRAVVTGASQGLGLRIAEEFAREGAAVVMCARSGKDLEAAATAIRDAAPQATVISAVADVSKAADVRRLADTVTSAIGGVDALVCNAGVYGPKGRIEAVEWQEWVTAIEVNLLGTVLCCREFIPHLERSRRGKIIVLSGGGATKPLPYLSAYAASKAGVVRFAETLAGELSDRNIDVNSVAPGALNTRLLDEVLEAGPEVVGADFHAASVKQKQSGGTPLDTGAKLCVYLASDCSDGITGKLISAVWDPWQDFDKYRDDLATDIYTLRRIVPAERGKSWG